MKVKVGDLGAAHLLESSLSSGPLSRQYLSPERMPREDGTAARSTLKSDVYSLGVTLMEIFTGIAPIVEERMSQLGELNSRRRMYQMCYGMINADLANRASAQGCLTTLAEERNGCREYGAFPIKRLVTGKFEGNVHKLSLIVLQV
eukprot:m.57463 g.57463  ORF g.57463 m.57463 type:complete len:146 (+) comp34738_c0_seq1:2-439(+)